MYQNELYLNWKNATKKSTKRLRNWLGIAKQKNHKKLNELSKLYTSQAYKKIDCMQCANCCKTASPIVRHSDSKRISKYLGMKENDFVANYLQIDEVNDYVMRSKPCPFLGNDNACAIYDVRPADCARYPHTNADAFTPLAPYHADNIAYCPISYAVIDAMIAEFAKGGEIK